MSLYNAKTLDDTIRITKFTDDLDVESSYTVSRNSCDCPAGRRDTCRHRQMFPSFVERIDTPWFLDWDNARWYYYNPETGQLLDAPRKSWRRL